MNAFEYVQHWMQQVAIVLVCVNHMDGMHTVSGRE